jgi:hypothetical protein
MLRTYAVFVLFFLFAALPLKAQSFSVSPNPNLEGVAGLEDLNVFDLYILNETNADIQLTWRLVGNTFPEEWEVSLCDNVACYGVLPTTNDFNPILVGDSSIFKIDVFPDGHVGAGLLTFWIYPIGEPTNYEVVTFSIVAGTSSTRDFLAASLSVFPNPATDNLFLRWEAEGTPFQIIDSQGRLVRVGETTPTLTTIPIQELPSGRYFLQLMHQEGIITQQVIIQHQL